MRVAISIIYKCFNGFTGLPAGLWWSFCVRFFDAISRCVSGFFALYLVDVAQLNTTQIGVVIFSYAIGVLFGSYTGGHLSDSVNATWISLASSLAKTAVLLGLLLASAYTTFIMMALLLGLFEGSALSSLRVGLAELSSDNNRMQVISVCRMLTNLGSALGTFCIGHLFSISADWLFFVCAISSLLVGVILFALRHSDQLSHGNASVTARPRPLSQKSEAINKTQVNRTANKKLLILFSIVLLVNIVYMQQGSSYHLYLSEYYHLTPQWIGELFAINALVVLLFEVPLLSYLNRYQPLYVAMLGAGLICLGFAVLPFYHTFWYASLSCLVWSFGEILTFSVLFSYLLTVVGEKNKGRKIGLYQTIPPVGKAIAPALGLSVYHYLNPNYIWYACFVIAVASILLFLYLIKYEASDESG